MPKDHLIRMALRIHRQLCRMPTESSSEWMKVATELMTRIHSIERDWRLARLARGRGWNAAAAIKEQHVQADARLVELAASAVRYQPIRPVSNPPTLGTIIAELRQLKSEFDDFEIDLKKGLIGVSTEPVVLEGINLGPFTIDLHISRLADNPGSHCFNCTAIEPNPAASSESTVHPHVQDGHLCAGDATVPITNALKEGRIADAFMLVRSVLTNYNPDSPYIAMENWSGIRCADCGDLADSEYTYFCDGCSKDVCDNCYGSCDLCDQGCCHNCLETDHVSGNRCCPACRRICLACDRTVDEESFDSETELCPGCHEQHKQENTHEPDSQSSSATNTTTVEPAEAPEVPAAA